MNISIKQYLKDFWRYIVGETDEFPHRVVILNCYSHIAAFTARHNEDLIANLNIKGDMKFIRLKYMRLMKAALSWFEFRSILLELLLIMNAEQLIIGEGINLDKKFKKPIGFKEIIASINTGTPATEDVYTKKHGEDASKHLSASIDDAKRTFDFRADQEKEQDQTTSGLINKEWKEYECVDGYHVWKPYKEFPHIGIVWKSGDSHAKTIVGNTSIKIKVIKDENGEHCIGLKSTTYNPSQFHYLYKQLIVRAPFFNDMVVGGSEKHNNQGIENYFKNLKVKFFVIQIIWLLKRNPYLYTAFIRSTKYIPD